MKRIAVIALCILATACGGEPDDAPRTVATDSTGRAAPRMTEAEVIGTMLSATEGLAHADSAALRAVTQPAVLRYAQVLRTDHRAIADEIKAVADSMKVAGARSDAGDRLRTGAGSIATALQDSTADLTMAFLNGQIDVQRQLIGALDSAMIPAATTAQLRQVLQDLRPAMVAHLQRGEQLKQIITVARSAPRAAAAAISPSAARRDTAAVQRADPPPLTNATTDPTPDPATPPAGPPAIPPRIPPQVPPQIPPDTIPLVRR